MIKYIIFLTILLLFVLPETAFAVDEYTEAVLYTIPWGDQPNQISSDFMNIPPDIEDIMPPGPWAVSETGRFIITDWTADKSYLKIFDFNGQLLSVICIEDNDLVFPFRMAMLDSGEIAIAGSSVSGRVMVLDSSLQVLDDVYLPFFEPIT
ncbi:MAG: hypothetical protein ABIG42_00395, partial [bacterium]